MSDNLPPISVVELNERLKKGETIQLLDVREDDERQLVNIGGHHIPLQEIPARHGELESEKELVVYCHHGMRSAHAVGWLQSQGFSKARNLSGGIDRWSLEVDPSKPRY
jgi:rhodanese-related sulfurtransferase